MAIRVERQAEPIPGYRLLEPLGRGGFGEVWKCEAPGGILKAVKFVYGNLETSTAEEEIRVRQELKALNRVKTVRHPYILSLERFDIIDGQLVIVMELADCSLWDRFRECRSQGLPGIPRDDLMRYMEETAEALDLMNIQYQLQHLDIKPQNLFLVHNHVKVADFGLVKDLEGMHTEISSGVTPIYAAPETFDGVISRHSDQYNLGIVYQELLTGQRPFAGTNVRQLLMQHLTGTPDLSPLPPSDRKAVARALSKVPEDRFPTCRDFVEALRNIRRDTPARVAAEAQQADTAAPETRVPIGPTATIQLPVPPRPRPSPAEAQAPQIPDRPEVTGDGVLFPAVVVSIGGLGLSVVQQVRRALVESCGDLAALPNIRWLHLDTDPDVTAQAVKGDPETALTEDNVLLTRLNRPSHYLKPVRGSRPHDAWLDANILCKLPREQVKPEGIRILGRLALADNHAAITARLKTELEACSTDEALQTAQKQTELHLRTNQPRVYVITSLGGGTGSGMFIDLGYVLRRVYQEMGFRNPDVAGVLLLPAADRNPSQMLSVANTFAALAELNHFAAREVTFTAFYHETMAPIADRSAPFRRTILVPLPKESAGKEAFTETAILTGDFLCRELITPLGRAADLCRESIPATPGPGLTCQTFGSCWFALPRRPILRGVAQFMCHRLVQSWLSKDVAPIQEAVQAWVADQSSKWQVRPEALTGRLQAACERAVGQTPESLFVDVIERFAKPVADGVKIDLGVALQGLAQIEQLVGRPPTDEADEAQAKPSVVEEALDQATQSLFNDLEKRAADLTLGLIEEPKFRLVGAEEAIRRMIATLEQSMKGYESLGRELPDQAIDAYNRIHSLVYSLQKGTVFSGWFKSKAKAAAELAEAMRQYAKARYQSLVIECVNEIYKGLLESLPDRLQDVTYCRNRLAELLRVLEPPPRTGRGPVDLGPGRAVLPAGCRTVDDVVDQVCTSLTGEEMLDLDLRIQAAVLRKQFKSLVHSCTHAGTSFKDLKPAILHQAEGFAETCLDQVSVAQSLMEQQPDEEAIKGEIDSAFAEAVPELGGTRSARGREVCILALADDAAGHRFRQLAGVALPDVDLVPTLGTDDILFYRELPHLPLAEVPQVGPVAQEAYQQMLSQPPLTPHSRTDIADWLPCN